MKTQNRYSDSRKKDSFELMFYQRKTMFNKIIWCSCVLLLLVSIDFKGIECRLLLKLQNVAAFAGEIVTLQCASTETSKDNIAWGISGLPQLPDRYIFSGILNQDFSGYYVSEKDDGSSVLVFTASITTANRYFCFDGQSHDKWSAELVVPGKSMECDIEVQNDSVTVNCSIEYAGNWAPVVECKQNSGKTVEVLQGNKTDTKRDENTATADIWTFHTKNKLWEIICSTKFKQPNIPKETNATNIPKFFSELRVYQPTRECQSINTHSTDTVTVISSWAIAFAVIGGTSFFAGISYFLYQMIKKNNSSSRNNLSSRNKSSARNSNKNFEAKVVVREADGGSN